MLIGPDDVSLPVFDSTRIHAEQALDADEPAYGGHEATRRLAIGIVAFKHTQDLFLDSLSRASRAISPSGMTYSSAPPLQMPHEPETHLMKPPAQALTDADTTAGRSRDGCQGAPLDAEPLFPAPHSQWS